MFLSSRPLTRPVFFLQRSDIPSAAELQLYSFDFDDMQMGDDVTLKACIRMFMEADLINRFKVPYEVEI